MNRREFISGGASMAATALLPTTVVASAPGQYRGRVLYPLNDKYKFAAVERRFPSYAECARWLDKYRGAPRTIVDIKNLFFPESSSLKDWVLKNKPKDCPARLFQCKGV